MKNESVLFDKCKQNKNIASRLRKANISMIKEMMYVAEIEKQQGKNIVSLGVGVPYYKMPKYIKNGIAKRLMEKEDIDKYTFFAGMRKLRDLIAKQAAKDLGIKTARDNIIITPGSMGALFYTMLTLIEKGDEVILLSPYFPSYAQQILIAGGKVIEVPLKKSPDGNFLIDLKSIAKVISKKTKAIIINSPHNPTGAIFQRKELEDLAKIIKKTGIYVITDEVYDFLIYDNKPYFNIASIKKLWPKVIRCRSLSKKYGMTGWRVGYLHTDIELVKHILKVHDNAIVCTPHISQEAAFIALSKNSDEVKKNRLALLRNRSLICKKLGRLKDLFSFSMPKGTYYVFPKYNLPMKSTEFALKLLHEARVIVTPGVGFGQAGEKHIRMFFGCSPDEINEAFNRIEKWWREYKAKNE